MSVAASGATYYVNGDRGNDNNPGSLAEPWATVGRALPDDAGDPKVEAGDTVKICALDGDANYGDISYDIGGDAEHSSWILYEANDTENMPIIQTLDINCTNAYMKWSYIKFENPDTFYTIDLQGAYEDVTYTPLFATTHVQFLNCNIDHDDTGEGPAFFMRWTTDITIDDCEVTGGDPQIRIDLHTADITVTDSNLHHSFGDIIDASYVQTALFENNQIHHVDPNQICPDQHWDALALADCANVTVSKNTFHSIGYSQCIYTVEDYGTNCTDVNIVNNLIIPESVEVGTEALKFYETDGLLFHHNTVRALGNDGNIGRLGGFNADCSGVVAYNNIITGGSEFADGSGGDLSYNIIENFDGDVDANSRELSEEGEDVNNVGFVDWLNGDYQLAVGSVAIGFSEPNYSPATDILGVERDASPDNGAYEYVGATPTPTPTPSPTPTVSPTGTPTPSPTPTATPAIVTGPIKMTSDCVAHLMMNDTKNNLVVLGTVPANNTHNGTSQRHTATVTVAGKIRNAISCDGSVDYISITDHDDFSFVSGGVDQPFSVSMWVYCEEASVKLIGKKGVLENEWGMWTNAGDALYVALYDASEEKLISRAAINLTVTQDQWEYVTFTYDGSATAAGIKIYLNAARVDDYTVPSTAGYVSMENLGHDVWLGRETTTYSQVAFDNLTIFDKELSGSEISFLWKKGNGTEDLKSLTLWRRFLRTLRRL